MKIKKNVIKKKKCLNEIAAPRIFSQIGPYFEVGFYYRIKDKLNCEAILFMRTTSQLAHISRKGDFPLEYCDLASKWTSYILDEHQQLLTCDNAVAMYFPPAAPITILTFPSPSRMMDGEARDIGLLRGLRESAFKLNSLTYKFIASHNWSL